jgi:hypothetical protein
MRVLWIFLAGFQWATGWRTVDRFIRFGFFFGFGFASILGYFTSPIRPLLQRQPGCRRHRFASPLVAADAASALSSVRNAAHQQRGLPVGGQEESCSV